MDSPYIRLRVHFNVSELSYVAERVNHESQVNLESNSSRTEKKKLFLGFLFNGSPKSKLLRTMTVQFRR